MPTIFLIRHGQASFGERDYDRLTDLGCRQSRLVARRLVELGVEVARVISGPTDRHRATAEPIGEVDRLDPRLNEYPTNEILDLHGSGRLRLDGPERPVGADQKAAFQDGLEAALVDWIESSANSPCQETWASFAL